MDAFLLILILMIFLGVGIVIYRRKQIAQREEKIDEYTFPPAIIEKLQKKHPDLRKDQTKLVLDALREYFHICNIAGRRMVSMPSQVVDDAWHEFILFTKNYDHFCRTCLGRFLHHTPAEAMSSPTKAQQGIKTAWRIACFRAGISQNKPSSLPLLFGIDALLNIKDGFNYSLDCEKTGRDYCASHIGCGSGCSGCSGDSSGCSGGCGGD